MGLSSSLPTLIPARHPFSQLAPIQYACDAVTRGSQPRLPLGTQIIYSLFATDLELIQETGATSRKVAIEWQPEIVMPLCTAETLQTFY